MVGRIVGSLEGDNPVLNVVVHQLHLDAIIRVLADFLKLLRQSLNNLGVHCEEDYPKLKQTDALSNMGDLWDLSVVSVWGSFTFFVHAPCKKEEYHAYGGNRGIHHAFLFP